MTDDAADYSTDDPRSSHASPAAQSAQSPQQLEPQHVHALTPIVEGWAGLLVLAYFVIREGINDGFGTILRKVRELNLSQVLHELSTYTWAWIFIGICFAFAIIWLCVSWQRRLYWIADDTLYYREGIIRVSERSARLNRIEALDWEQSFVQRLFGLGKLVIETAGGDDSQFTIELLNSRQTNRLETAINSLSQQSQNTQDRQNTHSQSQYLQQQGGDDGLATSAPEMENTNTSAASTAVMGDGDTIARTEPQGEPRFSIALPKRRVILSSVTTTTFVAILGLFFFTFASNIWLAIVEGQTMGLAAVLPFLIGAAINLNAVLGSSWNFTLQVCPPSKAAPEKGPVVKTSHGTTTLKKHTIRCRRIHNLELHQPLLWRLFGWWKLEASIAGIHMADTETTVLLPVATYDEALAVIHEIEVLGKPVDDRRLDEDTVGADDGSQSVQSVQSEQSVQSVPPASLAPTWQQLVDPQWMLEHAQIRCPRQARWLSPIRYRRRTAQLTDHVLAVRSGLIAHTISIMTTQHIQYLSLSTGPIQRRLGLTTVVPKVITGPVQAEVKNIDPDVAAELVTALRQRESPAVDVSVVSAP